MNKFLSIPALLLATACATMTPETRGYVTAFNGSSVTIRGGFVVGDGKPAYPTAAMFAQASEVCGSTAKYLSATPDEATFDNMLYLFRC